MITPQDIREKTFEKAVFGGYDMASVDSFLEELASDLALLQKENGVLKAKMKVLVDKVDEYRGNEDALRSAVLSAQKMGIQIEREAREKAEGILESARAEAEQLTADAGAKVEAERVRLERTKSESVRFLDSMDLLCRRQLEFLQKVESMDFVKAIRADAAEPGTVEVHETVKGIEEAVDARSAEEPETADDERPTRPFNVVTDPDDALQSTAQFTPKA